MMNSLSMAPREPLIILMDAPGLVNFTQKQIDKSYLPFKTAAGIVSQSE